MIPYYNSECECVVVLLINARRRVKGHHLVSEVFRVAVMTATTAIILTHNHPSGDPLPSPRDIVVTRKMIRAGQLLGIEVLDHIIMGNPRYASLRELGYFSR